MFKNHLKMTYRNLLSDKTYSLINLAGLIIGITSFILITFYVYGEYSFDDFHKNGNRIYRLNKIYTPLDGDKEQHTLSSGMMAQTIVNEYPEIESALRVFPWFPDVYLKKEGNAFKISQFVAVDSNFFTFFDFKLLKGNAKTALAEPMSVVLSESVADKLFGSQNPLGETITDLNDHNYKVTGVLEDPPENSHLQYEVLLSWSSTVPGSGAFSLKWLNNWLTQALYTYITVKPNTNMAALEVKLQDVIKNHLPRKVTQYHLYLQPLKDIFLGSSEILYTRKILSGNGNYVRLFLITSLLILLIAAFNYINLTNARSLRRIKEVGVRKSLGATKKQILKQFLTESLIFALVASAFSIILFKILLPFFNVFTQKHISIDWILLILFAIVISIAISLVSGTYLAFLLSKLNLINILKGHITNNTSKSVVRKTTVAFQFVISIVLISSTIVIYYQVNFIMNKSMGFQKDQMLVMDIGNNEVSDHAAVFKRELLKNPDIKSATVTGTVPGLGTYSARIQPEGKSPEEDWTSYMFRINDFDFLKTFGMKMIEGRFFSKEMPSDTLNGVVINQTLANQLGWQEPLGKRLDIPGDIETGKVIGVIKDFNMNSLYQPVDPLVIYYEKNAQNIALKLNSQQMNATLQFIESKWVDFAGVYPFEYQFLDQTFEKMYQSDVKMRNIFSIFAGFAIFISCLGLIGIISYSSQLRIKEIGIRKVLGSSVTNIVLLLSREFLIIVTVSVLIALPLSYQLMNKWLQGFAYQIELTYIFFMMAGLISVLPAVLVLIFVTLKTANSNPAETLRME